MKLNMTHNETLAGVLLTCHSLLTIILLIISGLMNPGALKLSVWERYVTKMSKCSSLGSFKCLLPLSWSWRVQPLYLGVPSLIPARNSTKCTGLSSSSLKKVTSESFLESLAFNDSHEPIRTTFYSIAKMWNKLHSICF